MDHKYCRIGDYYPDQATPDVIAAIRHELARQWECIVAGGEWDPGRPPEPILALLTGPLAWARIPEGPPFDLNGEAHWVSRWERPDGVYLTLSSEGAAALGVRPVGLTRRRRYLAAEAGLTDATGDALTGDRALIGGWLPIVYVSDNARRADGPAIPLYRWAPEDGIRRWWRAHQPFASLDAIGAESIPDDCCQAEKERVFTRTDPEAEAVDRAIMAGAAEARRPVNLGREAERITAMVRGCA